MATMKLQDLHNRRYNFTAYDSAISGAISPANASAVGLTFATGSLNFSATKPAHEIHIYCDVAVSLRINGGLNDLISLGTSDLPYVIDNMDVSTLYLTATSGTFKIIAFYHSS
jgi:hypothetical protein